MPINLNIQHSLQTIATEARIAWAVKVNSDRRAHWHHPLTALNYARAAERVGLWASERKIITEHFDTQSRILELGCGGGRVGLGLWHLGYQNVLLSDFSPEMVDIAESVLKQAGVGYKVEIADACELPYPDQAFDGVIFAFNGLMCLRGQADRLKALPEIHRILKPEGKFLFTANDREKGEHTHEWANEPCLPDGQLGDRWHETDSTPVFMHSSTEAETTSELKHTHFNLILSALRSDIAPESAEVRAFAGETRFYLAEKALR